MTKRKACVWVVESKFGKGYAWTYVGTRQTLSEGRTLAMERSSLWVESRLTGWKVRVSKYVRADRPMSLVPSGKKTPAAPKARGRVRSTPEKAKFDPDDRVIDDKHYVKGRCACHGLSLCLYPNKK